MQIHPNKKTYYFNAPAVAQGATAENPFLVAPFDFTLESVEYTTPSAITGANTNTRKVSVVNKGLAGAGTTEQAGLQFNSGVNTVAFDAKTVTLSGTATNLNGVEGDVLAWKSAHVGDGLADTGGLVKVVIARR